MGISKMATGQQNRLNIYRRISAMWKYLRFYFFWIYYRIWCIWKRHFGPVIVPPKDPIEEYVKPRRYKMLKTYELDLNANIDPVIYNKKQFAETMKDTKNELERIWKSRILYDSTPRGTIMMYYDIYKQGFAYYADQNNVPYTILNGMAMKYVVVFFCRDFYFDETVTGKVSPLIKVFLEDDIPERPKRMRIDQQHSVKPKQVEKNKFISLGNMRNFALLQKSASPLRNQSTKYDNLFSYKDFKRRQIGVE